MEFDYLVQNIPINSDTYFHMVFDDYKVVELYDVQHNLLHYQMVMGLYMIYS